MDLIITNLYEVFEWVFESIHIVGAFLLIAALFFSFTTAMTIYGHPLMYFLQLFIAIIPPVFILIIAVFLAISFTCLIAMVSFLLLVITHKYFGDLIANTILEPIGVFLILAYFMLLAIFALFLSGRAMNYTKNKNFYKWYFTTKFFKNLTFHKRLRLNWNVFRSDEDYLRYKENDGRGV